MSKSWGHFHFWVTVPLKLILDHRYICSNSQQYIVWLKIIIFISCQKSLRACSMNIFSKTLLITTLMIIFSMFSFLCTLRFHIFRYCPIITNHKSMEIIFIHLSDDAYTDPYGRFCGSGSHTGSLGKRRYDVTKHRLLNSVRYRITESLLI